jgi:hypothetical protein
MFRFPFGERGLEFTPALSSSPGPPTVSSDQAAADRPTPSRRSHNSLVGVLNRAAPQSRQTNTTGNVKTSGLVARVGLEKWSVTSPVNSTSFSDEHRAQDMTDTLRYCLTSHSTEQTR